LIRATAALQNPLDNPLVGIDNDEGDKKSIGRDGAFDSLPFVLLSLWG
jgi:hypothetical protein